MKATFLTGATGYLGSYLAAELLERGRTIAVLVRAHDEAAAARRLWDAWQLHFDFETFRGHLDARVRIVPGDLTAPGFGLSALDREALVESCDSILHCAASLNRRSERTCLNVNLRGTLAVVRLALEIAGGSGLRRFGQVSTVSVSGERAHEVVREDEAIDWSRRDYDAYGRTKKFAEHLVREMLAGLPVTIFRPAIVMGDSRRAETTQFDMVRAFSILASLPALPLRPLDRIDIVPVDWVARSIVGLHEAPAPRHDVYHLSAGLDAPRYREITDTLAQDAGARRPLYLPGLERPFAAATGLLARSGRGRMRAGARLLDVFLPYLFYDTVFDNTRAVAETGESPASFLRYASALLGFSRRHGFRYPHLPWPESVPSSNLREVGA